MVSHFNRRNNFHYVHSIFYSYSCSKIFAPPLDEYTRWAHTLWLFLEYAYVYIVRDRISLYRSVPNRCSYRFRNPSKPGRPYVTDASCQNTTLCWTKTVCGSESIQHYKVFGQSNLNRRWQLFFTTASALFSLLSPTSYFTINTYKTWLTTTCWNFIIIIQKYKHHYFYMVNEHINQSISNKLATSPINNRRGTRTKLVNWGNSGWFLTWIIWLDFINEKNERFGHSNYSMI